MRKSSPDAGVITVRYGIECGRSAATMAHTSRLVLNLADSSSSWWFSAVSEGISSRSADKEIEPSARRSRIDGNFHDARAASMRSHAASDERWRTSTQYLWSDE